ncbi:MAG: Hpt domain-containing protein [Stenotrophobium sp.]
MADSVLFLQPVINELRLARGQTLLSEPDLFVMQMKLVDIGFPANDNHDAARAQEEARKLLPAYQVSLLSWLKNDAQALAGVARIGKIAELVEAVSVDIALRQLWRTVTAVAEVLLTRALDESLDLKRLMGAAAQQLRLTALEGESAARAALGDLSWRLLFFASRAPSNGSRIAALRSQFNLQIYLPSEKQIQLAKAHLHGPNTTLLERVAGELRADFTQVKDEIDLYVRTGGKNENGPDLATTCGHLTRIASTLSALGLPGLQQVVLTQARVLADAHATPGNAPQWMDVAVALLRVEHSLDGALFHQLQRASGDARSNTELEVGIPHSHDFAEGRAAMLRETMVNQARFKTAVDAYMRGLELQLPAEAPKWLAEMASAMQMLQLDHAAELLKGIEQYVRAPGFAELRKDRAAAERFADTVALVDYYLEAMERGDLRQTEQMLERLGRNVDALSVELPVASKAEPAHLATTPPPQAPVADVAVQAVDPEIRDIFLEEAAEVRAELARALPGLKRDAQDKEAVTVIRRAFHTLKGSGRMVGATHIGEFGWTLESMLNRCLDGSIALNSQVVETVVSAVALLPGLIDGFRDGQAPGPEIAPLLERARNITAGRAAGADEEPDMAAVFRDDAREKLGAVRHWLAQQPAGHEHYAIDSEVTRAFHTLRGAAHVVQAPAISALAGALETYLDSMRRAGLGLPESALPLLADATATLQDWTQAVGSPQVELQNPDSWISRIHEMQAHVPDQAVQATADDQLAEIFSSEAADLVQKIEDTALAWARAPENGLAGGEIKLLCHTLQGAALMSQCRPVADLAAAIQRDIVQLQNREATPNAEFFDRLKETVERLYQLLDLYREGTLSEDRAREITQLPWQAAPASAAPSTAVADDAVARTGMDIVESEAAIEMPPVDEILMPEVEAAPEIEPAPAIAHGSEPEPEPVEGISSDAELHLIFISEARELLENLDAYCTAWERNPDSLETAAEILRVLHTLKGSARMAGFPEIGEIAQTLEQRVGEAHYAGTGDVALFSQLHQTSDGLYQALLDLEHGRIPNTVALMAELDSTGAAAAGPAEETLDASATPQQTATAVEHEAASGLETDFDPDLAEVFFAEAGELLESLHASLAGWKQQPNSFEPGREMLRALHTLKGGARMAGLQEMGNIAHELESKIEALEVRGGADASILTVLASDIDALQAMQDRWSRPLAGAIAAAPKPLHAAAPSMPPPRSSAVLPGKWAPQLFWKPEHDDEALLAMRRETARVPVESLDGMLNQAGEISIYRSRLEAQSATLQTQLSEMAQAITRLREQLRLMNIETEAQIEARGLGHTGTQDRYAGDFDPLEMDRYTRMQELSRAVAESVGDLAALHATMDDLGGETDALLQQQGRINTEVQQGLMRTLMVPFSRQVARLQRVVRQVAHENNKLADVQFNGIESELDRNVLERMTAPLEHLLRNAVVHGIETPDARLAVGKSRSGMVTVGLHREGTQLLIELRDDGQGLDLDAIRRIAIKRGLMPADAEVSDDAAAQFIFEPGFSTARTLTQDAGRGVGMDVVASEVRQLGGTLELASERGQGTRFLVRLPLNLAISQALLVSVASEMYAIPLTTIEGIARIPRERIAAIKSEAGLIYTYGDHDYRIDYLGELIGAQHEISPDSKTVNAILVRIGEGVGAQERRIGVLVDALHGNREVVSKSIGSQISTVVGISGATILPDGRVVLILDVIALALDRTRRVLITRVSGGGDEAGSAAAERKLIMVVDDSITIRRVTERLLLRNGYRVALAKDGLDAMAQLQTENPAAVLLDIEMPRADGFEVAAFIRNSERIRELPIIMITSRSGDKHRERAAQIGVNRYLIKPFQEEQLMTEVHEVISGAGA